MQIIEDTKLDFNDVLLVPKRSSLESRSDVDVTRSFELPYTKNIWTGIPIIIANMDSVGTFNMAHALYDHGLYTALHKHYNTEEYRNWYRRRSSVNSFYSMGIMQKDFDKLKRLINYREGIVPYQICLDVANGYTDRFLDAVKQLREMAPGSFIIAGNVVSPAKTEEIITAGADCVKIGIGSGSACITRKVAGVGYPQLSAVMECADAAHGIHGLVCSDGGCNEPGDVVKAFAAGADFVMLGGMFAGSDEAEGTIILEGLKRHKLFYGMASKEANQKHYGGLEDYKASEGKKVNVPCTGPVSNTVQNVLGGLRSGMTYLGAQKLKELSRRATFIKVNRQANEYFK